METLQYLYGIVPEDAEEPGPGLAGVEGGAVRLVRGAGLAAIVSEVPADAYSDETLDARLSDLAWVGERGIAHETVLDWFAERGPVVPLSLFSLHRGDEVLRTRLEADAARFIPLLERLRGRREWGVKLWRRDELLKERMHELSPLLRSLEAEIEAAPPGKRFLLTKKRETARTEELRSLSRRVAHQVYSSVAAEAEKAQSVALPPSEGARVLILHGAFLVPEDRFPAFQAAVTRAAHEFGDVGFEVEFTGPWPPYHFSDPDR